MIYPPPPKYFSNYLYCFKMIYKMWKISYDMRNSAFALTLFCDHLICIVWGSEWEGVGGHRMTWGQKCFWILLFSWFMAFGTLLFFCEKSIIFRALPLINYIWYITPKICFILFALHHNTFKNPCAKSQNFLVIFL